MLRQTYLRGNALLNYALLKFVCCILVLIAPLTAMVILNARWQTQTFKQTHF